MRSRAPMCQGRSRGEPDSRRQERSTIRVVPKCFCWWHRRGKRTPFHIVCRQLLLKCVGSLETRYWHVWIRPPLSCKVEQKGSEAQWHFPSCHFQCTDPIVWLGTQLNTTISPNNVPSSLSYFDLWLFDLNLLKAIHNLYWRTHSMSYFDPNPFWNSHSFSMLSMWPMSSMRNQGTLNASPLVPRACCAIAIKKHRYLFLSLF